MDYIINYYPFIIFFLLTIYISFVIRRYGKKIKKNNNQFNIMHNFLYLDGPILSTIGLIITIIDYIASLNYLLYIYGIVFFLYIIIMNTFRLFKYKKNN